MNALQKVDSNAEFRFWGGDLMQAVGGDLVMHYKERQFMGFAEVIMNLRKISGHIKFCKKDIDAFKPDVIIFIDNSGFNLRIAKWAKAQHYKTHYYISPQVWASRASRVENIKHDIDEMYCILPFEKEFYSKRAPKEWLEALEPLGTDPNKPFLETAPYLIAIFYKSYDILPDGKQVKQYYAMESTGIATGMLLTAIHNAGLVSLTHTPSPMNFLNEILGRPKNERPFLLLVVGYPAKNAKVPDIKRKKLDEISSFFI